MEAEWRRKQSVSVHESPAPKADALSIRMRAASFDVYDDDYAVFQFNLIQNAPCSNAATNNISGPVKSPYVTLRAWMGNAVYRDMIQALVMVELECLVLAVPNGYRYISGGRAITSRDYENTCAVADALFGHTRIRMPYQLVVIGY
jgi:hypothetical protein